MSDSTPPTDPNALLFPAFSYGDHTSCRRKMKAEAKKWGKRYQERGDFPETKLIPVPPGSSIFLGDQSDLDFINMGMRLEQTRPSPPGSNSYEPDTVFVEPLPNRNQPRWYFYLVDQIRWELLDHIQYEHPQQRIIHVAYEAFACRYPWGALSLAIGHSLYHTIDAVSQRVEAVLSFWEKLDTVRYIDPVPIRCKRGILADLLAFRFESHIAMWVDAPTGNIRQDLRTAIDQMRRASDDEIHTRLIRQLHHEADTNPYFKHREWLKSPGVIEAELVIYAQKGWRHNDDPRAGYSGSLSAVLAGLERKFPGS